MSLEALEKFSTLLYIAARFHGKPQYLVIHAVFGGVLQEVL